MTPNRYRIEIANRIGLVAPFNGTDYVVTANGMIVARFAERDDASAHLVRLQEEGR